jgi:hypothetical protein
VPGIEQEPLDLQPGTLTLDNSGGHAKYFGVIYVIPSPLNVWSLTEEQVFVEEERLRSLQVWKDCNSLLDVILTVSIRLQRDRGPQTATLVAMGH